MADEGGKVTAAQSEWKDRPERGSAPAVRFMVWLSLTLGRRVSRLILHPIAAYFLLFAPAARRASRDYLRRALGRAPGVRDSYRHMLCFASVIHDRVYWLCGPKHPFQITVSGQQVLDKLIGSRRGGVFLGAHCGSFEALRVFGDQCKLNAKMLMYADNARHLMGALAAIDPKMHERILAMGQPESILRVRDHLAAGGCVGILSDRMLASGKSRALPFLGDAALFATGPLQLAAALRAPVMFMAGVYLGGNRYHLSFENIVDFAETPATPQPIAQALERYVSLLERLCLQAPYNWFNFYDFWKSAKEG